MISSSDRTRRVISGVCQQSSLDQNDVDNLKKRAKGPANHCDDNNQYEGSALSRRSHGFRNAPHLPPR